MPCSGWEKTPWYCQRLLRDHHAPWGHKVSEVGSGVLEGASHVTHFHPSPHGNPPARPLHIHPVLARAHPRTGKHATSYLMALTFKSTTSFKANIYLPVLSDHQQRESKGAHTRPAQTPQSPLCHQKAPQGLKGSLRDSPHYYLQHPEVSSSKRSSGPLAPNRPHMAAEQRRAQMAPSTAAQGLVLCSTLKS